MAARQPSSPVNAPFAASETISFEHPAEGTLLARLSGSWKIGTQMPASDEITPPLQPSEGIRRLGFETDRSPDGTAAC